MALRSDSYGSVAEVVAFARVFLDGQTNFNSTTKPTLTEVEKFIDRSSGFMNSALNQVGLTSPVTNSTAKLILDDWVVKRATEYCEATQHGVGYSGDDRQGGSLLDNAISYIRSQELAFKRLGVGVSHKSSAGLQFTALDDQDERDDPDDSALEQPLFARGLFGSVDNEAVDDGV